MCCSVFIGTIKCLYPDSILSLMLTEICDPGSLRNYLHLLSPAAPKTQKPKLLKPQPRKVVLVSIPCVLPVHVYLILFQTFNKIRCMLLVYRFPLPPAKDSGGEFDLRRTGLGDAYSWRHSEAQRHRICSDPVWGAAAMRPNLPFPFHFCLKKWKKWKWKKQKLFMVCIICASNYRIHFNDGMRTVFALTFPRGYRWALCSRQLKPEGWQPNPRSMSWSLVQDAISELISLIL